MVVAYRRLTKDDPEIAQAFAVLRDAFAGMEGRIDPPSSLGAMTAADLVQSAETSEVWVAGDPVAGTVTLTPKDKVLYVGKLAVRDTRNGLGRALIGLAGERAVALGYDWLELQSRVELVEVHAVFKALGFTEVMRTTHAGYLRPTSITFRKTVVT